MLWSYPTPSRFLTAVVSLEGDQARFGLIKGISLNFRPWKYLPTYLQNCKHEGSTRIPNYTLQTKQVGVHTTLESYSCAATYDQSSTTTNICYASRTRLPILSQEPFQIEVEHQYVTGEF